MAGKKTEFDRRQREQMARIVGAAWEGKLKWVDEIIGRAGYMRGDMASVPARVIARLYGVTPQAVGLWHSKSGCPRNGDATYDVGAVARWHEDWMIDSLQRQGAIETEASPAQERYRMAKAQREEIALERDRGTLLAREDVHSALGRLAVILRGAGEALGRKFGDDAQSILEEALDDFTAEIRRTFDDGDGEEEEG